MQAKSIGRAGVLILVAMLAGEGTGLTRDAAGVLTGEVVDAQTGSPIAGARVTLSPSGRHAMSGADGSFAVAAVAGTYAVRCAKAGYITDHARGIALVAGAHVSHMCRLRRRHRHAADDQKAPAAPPPPADKTVAPPAYHAYRKREAYAAGTAATRAPMTMPAPQPARGWDGDGAERPSREGYSVRDENPFVGPSVHPLSTFSIDVDTAGYANLRRFLEREGRLPPHDAVKIEEMVNYFPYGYREPDRRRAVCGQHRDLVGAVEPRPPAGPHRPAGQAHGSPQAAGLEPDLPARRVGLDGRAGQAAAAQERAVAPGARAPAPGPGGDRGLRRRRRPGAALDRGRHKDRILAALDQLQAGGSTAGAAGIQLAYQVARQNFIRGGNNRVILATDGDFNVGASSDAELVRLIEQKRHEGVFLTVLGFGTGNYQDAKMEQLADKGNGNHAYIDTLSEARKVLVSEMGGTLFTVAKDVKLQIEFNPAHGQGLPPDRLREPHAGRRGLQRRQEGRRRARRRSLGDRALRDHPGRLEGEGRWRRCAQVPEGPQRAPGPAPASS